MIKNPISQDFSISGSCCNHVKIRSQKKLQSSGQAYRSMVDYEGAAVSIEGGALFKTLDLIAGVPNLSESAYRSCHGRIFNALRSPEMFLDGRSKTMADRRAIRHATDICAQKRRWSSKCQYCVCTSSQAVPFDMPSIRQVHEVAYLRRLYNLF